QYNPYQPYAPGNQYGFQQNRQLELERAKGRRGRGIALVVVGAVLTIGGLGVAAASGPNCDSNLCSGVYLGVGISVMIVGPTLFIPGAVSWAKSQRIINDLSKPEPTGLQPQTFIFPAPSVYF